MVEVGSLASAALNSAMPASPGAGRPEPSLEAVEKLAQLQGAPAPEAAAQPAAAAEDVQKTKPIEPEITPASGDTPGDSILRSIDRMSQGFDSTVDQITKAVDGVKPGEAMSAADILKLQFQLTQVTVLQDVTGKVAGKATQNLETFLKNQ
jgi:type III secretion system YscI/HrpB-like protein